MFQAKGHDGEAVAARFIGTAAGVVNDRIMERAVAHELQHLDEIRFAGDPDDLCFRLELRRDGPVLVRISGGKSSWRRCGTLLIHLIHGVVRSLDAEKPSPEWGQPRWLLVVLAVRKGEWYSLKEIARRLNHHPSQAHVSVSPETIRSYKRRLLKAEEPLGQFGVTIESIPGTGYRLVELRRDDSPSETDPAE